MVPLSALRGIARPPALVLDEHNVEFDLARQQASGELQLGPARRLFNAVNWKKLRREEIELWKRFDGVSFCSAEDEACAKRLVPSIRSAVVPNSVDVHYFAPRPADPKPDGRTLLFLGALNYFPNVDGVLHLLKHIWPAIANRHPDARLEIVGQYPTAELLAFRGPRVEFTGRVDDVRPHLAAAAMTIAPLRIGGGTRFKILEAMSMAKAVVATSIGAEGIDAQHGRHLLLADDPAAFAAAAARLLDDPGLAQRLGREGRALVEARYSWEASVRPLEDLYGELASGPRRHPEAARAAAGAAR
jgi:glycosyltransferase involved in cell wall biosynthesis